MTMKQTQTKMFDFSDVGLDFCAGSKNLFPDRFKKMLSLGYNEQTVSSVAVAGNQVTLTYGGTHGYVADRVLKVNAPELLSINGGEFVIDSVTENTVTITIDGAPASIAGNFTTKVASLGYDLVYEQANIHIYKFKSIDESDLYLRLCFQSIAAQRNSISPCIGKSYDNNAGVITDVNAIADNGTKTLPQTGFKWDFAWTNNATADNYNYSTGYATYGKGLVVGSLYHLLVLSNYHSNAGYCTTVGFFPVSTFNYDVLSSKVCLIGLWSEDTTAPLGKAFTDLRGYIGNTEVSFDFRSPNAETILYPQAINSFLPLDEFNTTTCKPIDIYHKESRQYLGHAAGGIYIAKYANANTPAISKDTLPLLTYDIDLSNKCFVHAITNRSSNPSLSVFFAVPVEEIKIA
ncbi:hypothetical protein [Acinetobacter sp. UBA2581]|uniref:hypothetical protein n=1 Tax=Acinetobacter sp. UBA2581 TaxID=1945932 RepID=UPI00257A4801|nr:hypothetical protein [Acinetobacter sp. UBA2581]